MSEKILDVKPYNKSNTPAKWPDTTLYHWLNHSFAKESFSSAEYSKLLNPFVKEPEIGIRQRVFLPTRKDLDNIFPDTNKARMCLATPYAQSRGIWSDPETGCGAWWINSTAGAYCQAIQPDGTFDRERGFAVDYDDIGIRPLIIVSYTPTDTLVNAPEGTVGYIELD